MQWALLAVQKWVLGEDHPDALPGTAGNLARSICGHRRRCLLLLLLLLCVDPISLRIAPRACPILNNLLLLLLLLPFLLHAHGSDFGELWRG